MLPQKKYPTRAGKLLLLSLFLLGAGCAERYRVQLRAPDPQAPLEERLAAYESLRPVTRTDLFFYKRKETIQSITLQDGTTIYHTRDLLPVVAAHSPTAAWAREEASYRRSALYWNLPLVGGAALSFLSMLAVVQGDQFGLDRAFFFSTTSLLASAPLTLIVRARNRRANQAREAAFADYDASLREYLNLCQVEEKLVDCDAAPSAPNSPEEAAEALTSTPTSTSAPVVEPSSQPEEEAP